MDHTRVGQLSIDEVRSVVVKTYVAPRRPFTPPIGLMTTRQPNGHRESPPIRNSSVTRSVAIRYASTATDIVRYERCQCRPANATTPGSRCRRAYDSATISDECGAGLGRQKPSRQLMAHAVRRTSEAKNPSKGDLKRKSCSRHDRLCIKRASPELCHHRCNFTQYVAGFGDAS
jgi:hypothetical protein